MRFSKAWQTKYRWASTTFCGAVFSASMAMAGAKEDALAALAKLAEADSYSWSTTTEGPRGSGQTVEGKAAKDGTMQLNMTVRDEPVEVFVRGQQTVVKSEGGWKSVQEIMQNAEPGQQSPAMMIARMARGYRAPVAQAEEVLEKVSDVTAVDGAFLGELAGDDAVPYMQMRSGRRGGGDGDGRRQRGGGPQDGPGGAGGGPGGPGGGLGGERPAPPARGPRRLRLKMPR